MRRKQTIRVLVVGVLCATFLSSLQVARAQEGEFSLQVMPSPLVEMLDPGQAKTVDIVIRNVGSSYENLDITLGSFDVDKKSGEIKLDDKTAPEIAPWTKFDAPNFTVQPGQLFTEHVTFDVPKDAGFSYHFTMSIKRHNQAVVKSGRQINGVVNVFGLVNVNRPGATRSFDVAQFSSTKRMYEYLPAEFTTTVKNTGNTIVQPAGNIFVQRTSDSSHPVSVLQANQLRGYVLPGGERSLNSSWNDGFPAFEPKNADDPSGPKVLRWNWSNLSHLRIGKYTAKLVAVYNDGHRDVPVVAETSFWVFPWKLILGAIVVLLLITVGLWHVAKLVVGIFRRKS